MKIILFSPLTYTVIGSEKSLFPFSLSLSIIFLKLLKHVKKLYS